MKLARNTTITRLVVQVAPALAAAVVALAATGSAAAVDGPVEGAAGGCALQCVEKALVTSTASSAKVAIVTSVPTRIVMTVRRLSSAGRVDGPAHHVDEPAPAHVADAVRLRPAAGEELFDPRRCDGCFRPHGVTLREVRNPQGADRSRCWSGRVLVGARLLCEVHHEGCAGPRRADRRSLRGRDQHGGHDHDDREPIGVDREYFDQPVEDDALHACGLAARPGDALRPEGARHRLERARRAAPVRLHHRRAQGSHHLLADQGARRRRRGAGPRRAELPLLARPEADRRR